MTVRVTLSLPGHSPTNSEHNQLLKLLLSIQTYKVAGVYPSFLLQNQKAVVHDRALLKLYLTTWRLENVKKCVLSTSNNSLYR